MVAIFTGEGAGFARGSANILGGAGQIGNAALGRAGEGVSINAATGGLVVAQQDEFLAGLGLDASVARTYNSLGETGDRDNGDNWQLSSTRRIWEDGASGDMMRLGADGSVIAYSQSTRGGLTAYWATDGSGTYDRIEQINGVWTWTDGDSKVQEIYEQSAVDSVDYRLLERRGLDHAGDPTHDKISFTYHAGSDRIDRISTANGEWLEYQWNGTNPDNLDSIQTGYTDLATSTAKTLTTTRYTYDSQNRLSTVTTDLSPEDELVADGNVYTVTYTYDGTSNRISSISQDDGSQVSVTYDAEGRVLSFTQAVSTGDTRLTQLDYQTDHTIITAPDGTTTRLDYVPVEPAPANLIDPDVSTWGRNQQVADVTDTGTTENGYPVYKVEGFVGTSINTRVHLEDVPVDPGKTYTFTVSLKAGPNGSTVETLAFSNNNGGTINLTATVLDGPGQLNQAAYGPNWYELTGLSSATATRVQFTWVIDSAASSALERISINHATPSGYAVGDEVFVSGVKFHEGPPPAAPAVNAGALTKITTTPVAGPGTQQITEFEYNTSGDLIKVIDSEGDETLYEHDDRGNITKITRPDLAYTVREYSSSAASVGDLLVSETYYGPPGSSLAPLETRYVYDSEGHLAFMVDAEGRVTEYSYTAEGLLEYSITYPDDANNVPPASMDFAAMETWRDGLTDRSTIEKIYTVYDARGNIVSTRRDAVSESDGTAPANSTDTDTLRYYTYDQEGRLLSRHNAGENSETFTYDGLGRVKTSSDLAGGTTTFVFGDLANANNQTTTTVTTAAGYVTVRTFNQAGELINETGSGNFDVSGTVNYAYDNMGRTRVVTDERGHKTYFVYDDLGRLTGTVSHDLTLTETIYDDANRVIATVAYDSVVASYLTELADETAEISIDDIRPGAAGGDLWAWTIYDGETGLVSHTIDGVGAVTEFTYDDADRLMKTTAYAVTLDANDIATFKATPPTDLQGITLDATGAVYSRSFYDASGRMIGALDAAGYLTETVYDNAGRVIEEIAYAQQTLSTHWPDGSFADLRGSVSQADPDMRSAHFVYDGRGNLRFQIDDHGGVSEFVYNEAGRQTSTIAYAATLSTSDYSYANIKSLTAGIADEATDRESYNVYNERGQVAYTVSAANEVTAFAYDTSGRVTSTTAYANTRNSPSLPALSTMNAWANGAAQASDPDNRISYQYYSDGGLLRFSIHGAKPVPGETYSSGYVTQYIYDAEGHNTAIRQYGSAIAVSASTDIDDLPGLLPAGYVEQTFIYDNLDRLKEAKDGVGTRTIYDFNTNGVQSATHVGLTTTSLDDQSSTVYFHDALGRHDRVGSAAGETEYTEASYTFNAFGERVQVTDGRGNSSTYEYDARGLLTKVTNAATGETEYEYNAFGEVVKAVDAEDGETYSWYDELGRAFKVLDAEGYLTETSYDRFGQIESVTRYYNAFTGTPNTATPPSVAAHAKDAVTSFTYDKAGRVIETLDAEGFTESYSYNAFGERASVTGKSETAVDAGKAGNTTTYVYNNRGLLVSETLPMSSVTHTGATQSSSVTNTYEYDARGNRTKMTEAAGLAEERVTLYEYDDANRLVKTFGEARGVWSQDTHALSNGAFVPSEELVYDARGNVIETIDAAGNRTVHFYDDLDRKTVEVDALGTYTAYEYDKNGNVTDIKVYETPIAVPAEGGSKAEQPNAPAGAYRETTFTYDALNRMETSTVVLDSSTQIGSWDGTASSWVSTTPGSLTTEYEYDHLGNVVKTTDPEGNETFAYYDKLSRKVGQIDADRHYTAWVYDAEGNVKEERRYAVAVVGTITTAGTTAPSAVGGRWTYYTYDKVGNRLSEARLGLEVHDSANPGQSKIVNATVNYTYNGLGQVLTKTEATGDQITYAYDDAGRLTSEQRDSYIGHTGASVTPQVDYDYDGLGNLTRSEAAGAAGVAARVSSYEYGAGGLLAKVTDAEGNIHEYFYDSLGRQIVDRYQRTSSAGVTATEAALTKYDALGRVTEQTVATQNGASWIKGDISHSEYDAFGDMVASGINKAGDASSSWQTQNRFDEAGRLYATNSGDGVWKFFGYDANGNQTAAITSAGYDFANLSSLTFDQALTKVSQSDVNATYTVYTGRGLATEVIEEGRELSATSTQTLTTTRSYNAFGEVITETDAQGATLSYTYSTAGKLIRSESPTVEITNEDGSTQWIRPSEDYYYDVSGRLVATRDANGTYAAGGTAANGTSKDANSGNLTQMSLLAGSGYGGAQALTTSTTHADGGVTEVKYDVHGDARTMIDQLSRTDSYTYDKLGRVTQVDHAGGLTDHFTYDEMGQQLTRWNNHYTANNKQTTDYDRQGRVTSQRAFGGDITTTAYTWDATLEAQGTGLNDTGGWVKTTTMANTRTLTEKTDAYGRNLSKNDLGSNATNYTYDAAGRQISSSISGPGGSASAAYTFFNTGQIATNSGPSGLASYSYDALGQKLTETLVDGGVTVKDMAATYDALGRMTFWEERSTSTAPESTITNDYDANGNIRRTQSTFYALDPHGNAFSTQTQRDYWYRFDSMNRMVTDKGQLSGAAGASGTVIERGYNGGWGGDTSEGRDILYDLAGQREAVLTTRYAPGSWVFTGGGGVPGGLGGPGGPGDPPGEGGGGEPDDDFVYDPGFVQEYRESYTYDDAGRLTEIRTSEGDRVYEEFDPNTLFWTIPDGPLPSAPTGGELISNYSYNALGQQTLQEDRTTTGGPTHVVYSSESWYNDKGQLIENRSSTHRSDDKTYTTITRNDYGTGANYALGAVVQSQADTALDGSDSALADSANTYAYDWYDGAVQKTIQHDNNYENTAGAPGAGMAQGSTLSGFTADYTTTQSYNGFGHLTSAQVNDGIPKTVTFTNDELGQIIRRDETSPSTQTGSPHEIWYRFGGVEMGFTGNNGGDNVSNQTSIYEREVSRHPSQPNGTFRGGSASGGHYQTFGDGYDALNSYAQGSREGQYTVRGGESFQQIAAQLYGDSSLWYKIAEANPGVAASGGSLIAGTVLQLPAGVIKTAHNASTFKPYDPGQAIGDLSPTTPKPQKGNNCGVVGAILLTVIAVAVTTIATAGAVSALSGKAFSLVLGAMTGGAAVGGVSTAAWVAGGAIGGAVGSAATQGVGVATGIQDKFSWKSVGIAAIQGGIGGYFQGLNNAQGLAIDKATEGLTGAAAVKAADAAHFTGAKGFLTRGGFTSGAVRAAASSALGQGIATATGLQDSFSWAGVVSAAIGGGVGSATGPALNKAAGSAFFGGLATGAASSLANAATRSAIEGSNFGKNIEAAIPDVIGQAIGGAIANAINGDGRLTAKEIANEALNQAALSAGYEPGTADYDNFIERNSRIADNFSERIEIIREEYEDSDDYGNIILGEVDLFHFNLAQSDPNFALQYEASLDLIHGYVGFTIGDDSAYEPEGAYDEAILYNEEWSDELGLVGGRVTDYGPNPSEAAIHEIADPLAIRTGRVVEGVRQSVGETIDAIPGGRIAVAGIDIALKIAGGPVRFAVGKAVEEAGQEAETGIANRFARVGYSSRDSNVAGTGAVSILTLAAVGLSAFLGGIKKVGSGPAYKHNYSYSDRVLQRSLEDPKFHNFPYSMDDIVLRGSQTLHPNGYTMYRSPGRVNGTVGRYEIGVTKDGIINHRTFIPD